MEDVVLFNGINSIDFCDVRMGVIRIPEVSARISEAQEVWDSIDDSGFNFYNFLSSEDHVFLNNIKLKSLAAAIIQVGLYDRYRKRNKQPDILIGCVNGDSPLKVCLGDMTFAEMVLESNAVKVMSPVVPLFAEGSSPVLSGICLTEFAVFKVTEDDKSKVEADKMDIKKILDHIIDGHGAKKLVNIGPGSSLIEPHRSDLSMRDIQLLESIELDPMLNWFWTGMSRPDIAAAQ